MTDRLEEKENEKEKAAARPRPPPLPPLPAVRPRASVPSPFENETHKGVFSESELSMFEEKGYVILKSAFAKQVADRCREEVLWPLLEKEKHIEKNAPSTWPSHVGISTVFYPKDHNSNKKENKEHENLWNHVITDRLLCAIDQLVGGRDRWDPAKLGLGWWAVSFPQNKTHDGINMNDDSKMTTLEADSKDPDSSSSSFLDSSSSSFLDSSSSSFLENEASLQAHGAWHIDGSHFLHRANSKEQGLLPLFLFSDIKPRCGGTLVAVGSHKVAAQELLQLSHGETIASGPLAARVKRHPGILDDVEEIVGEAGDVAMLHPFLLHARGSNFGKDCVDSVRFICNPCVAFSHDMNLDVDTSNASHVERPILEMKMRLQCPMHFGQRKRRRRR